MLRRVHSGLPQLTSTVVLSRGLWSPLAQSRSFPTPPVGIDHLVVACITADGFAPVSTTSPTPPIPPAPRSSSASRDTQRPYHRLAAARYGSARHNIAGSTLTRGSGTLSSVTKSLATVLVGITGCLTAPAAPAKPSPSPTSRGCVWNSPGVNSVCTARCPPGTQVLKCIFIWWVYSSQLASQTQCDLTYGHY